jgi:hypothetical protein
VPATTKRRLKRDERRLVIEDAAAELLATRGYAKTRTLDIAAAAGNCSCGISPPNRTFTAHCSLATMTSCFASKLQA